MQVVTRKVKVKENEASMMIMMMSNRHTYTKDPFDLNGSFNSQTGKKLTVTALNLVYVAYEIP